MHNQIAVALLASLIINFLLFAVAFFLRTDKLTDASYSLSFITLAVYGYLKSSGGGYEKLLLALVLAWGLRLGIFLVIRIRRFGRDKRFDDIRNNFWKFGRFWLLQAVTVWVLMLGYLLAIQRASLTMIRWPFAVGLVIWLMAIVIESVADLQKLNFNSQPRNRGKWIDSGLWRYSRHPNYLGEMMIWIGVFLICISVLPRAEAYVAALSPLLISNLLLFVSGVPILEKAADQKWGKLAAYQNYKKRTATVVPFLK